MTFCAGNTFLSFLRNRNCAATNQLLLRTLEEEARRQSVCTIWLGTDDNFGGTNIFGTDLYPNVLQRMTELQPASGHPYTFYRRMGYVVVGVIPDADRPGKHDILMAKRIS